MNKADTRKAMNIPDSAPAWHACGGSDYEFQKEGSYWIYHVLRYHMRILHFSGNTDGAVPTLGTERWIDQLGWEIKERYHPWMVNDQVAGFIERRDGIDFATV